MPVPWCPTWSLSYLPSSLTLDLVPCRPLDPILSQIWLPPIPLDPYIPWDIGSLGGLQK